MEHYKKKWEGPSLPSSHPEVQRFLIHLRTAREGSVSEHTRPRLNTPARNAEYLRTALERDLGLPKIRAYLREHPELEVEVEAALRSLQFMEEAGSADSSFTPEPPRASEPRLSGPHLDVEIDNRA